MFECGPINKPNNLQDAIFYRFNAFWSCGLAVDSCVPFSDKGSVISFPVVGG